MADGRVKDAYGRLKDLAIGFGIRPGERLNEGALSRSFGISRTPLREALNRLVAENLFEFRPGEGFFARELNPKTIFDLFELRGAMEVASVRLAVERADDTYLVDLDRSLRKWGLSVAGLTVAEACKRDEDFHIAIATATGNKVLADELARVNDRIRFIRWLRLTPDRIASSKLEHLAIMEALLARDAEGAAAAMSGHIEARMDQIVATVREGISSIYLDTDENLEERLLEEST